MKRYNKSFTKKYVKCIVALEPGRFDLKMLSRQYGNSVPL